MKSAQTRAAELCRKLGLPVDETENGVAYQIILSAMREHEQDTRIACAKAVGALPRRGFDGIDIISEDNARKACLFAKVE